MLNDGLFAKVLQICYNSIRRKGQFMIKKLTSTTHFIKYIMTAVMSFLIDITLFTVINFFLKNVISAYSIIVATVLARIISSFVNYYLNRNKVFGSNQKGLDKKTFIKYYLLVIIQMFVSSFLVFKIFNITSLNETLIKVPVEGLIFIVNFFVQKYFIFIDKKINIRFNHSFLLILACLITSLSFVIKLDVKTIILLNKSNTDALLSLILTCFIFFFYKKYLFTQKKYWPFNILAFIFSLFLVIGYSYDNGVSSEFLIGNIPFMIISILKTIGFYLFFCIILNLIYEKINNSNLKALIKDNFIIRFYKKHPFWFTIIVLLICYLPYIVSYYPIVMSYDPANQIKEFMGIPNRYIESVVLINPNVTITGFNPVIHTLLIGECFNIGVTIGNVNLGLFLYSAIQILTMLLSFGYLIYYLRKEKVNDILILIVLGIIALVPVFPFYAMSSNKDTYFSLFLLLFSIKVYDVIKNESSFKDYLLLTILSIIVILFRNNGIFSVIATLPLLVIFLKNKRVKLLVVTLLALGFYASYNHVLLPYFEITPTSKREVLSIPFQQTANLINKAESVLTEKDKKTISKILDYEITKTSYDPDLSDKVKNTYNKYTTNKDLMNYFKVWIKYFFVQPRIYFDATLNNVYGYYYPDTSSWYIYYKYNSKLKEAGFNYHYNSLSTTRNILSSWGNVYPKLPVIGLLVNIAFNSWMYMYMLAFLINSKKSKYIIMLIPYLTLVFGCFFSPANTYFRYALPFVMALPFMLALLYSNLKTKN